MVLETDGKGGTERYCELLASHLASNNTSTTFLFANSTQEKTFRGFPILKSPGGFGTATQEIVRGKYDIIHMHLYSSFMLASEIFAKCEIPTIATLHMPYSQWNAIQRWKWRRACRNVDAVFGVSRAVVKGLNGRNISDISAPSPLASQWFNASWPSTPNPTERSELNVCALGRLSKEKDWPTLYRAASLSRKPGENVRIHHFGEGEQKASLRKLATALRVPVVMHGNLDSDQLLPALSQMDCAVLPSRFEGMPLSAMETMSLGMPTICSNFSSAPELIQHMDSGIIFPQGRPRQLAKALRDCFDNYDRMLEIGNRGKEHVRNTYQAKYVFKTYIDQYRNSADRRSSKHKLVRGDA